MPFQINQSVIANVVLRISHDIVKQSLRKLIAQIALSPLAPRNDGGIFWGIFRQQLNASGFLFLGARCAVNENLDIHSQMHVGN